MGVRAKGTTERARRQKVLIGPWIHSLGERGTQSRTGDVDFGAASLIDLRREELRWFDYWLRGVDDGIMSEPPVKVFVMGANAWRTAADWPIPGTRFVPHYFHSGGHASTLWGDGALDRRAPAAEPPDRYVYDPADPVPTLGGSTCCGEDITPISMGPRDQRIGGVAARCPRVLDAPARGGRRGHRAHQGRAVGGLVRAGHGLHREARRRLPVGLRDERRAGDSARALPRFLRAAEPPRARPSLPSSRSIAGHPPNLFRRGHRIRVEIASSNFPQFDRNPNTGRPFGEDADLVRATQTVYHDAQHPSHILLPIVD